MFDPLICMAQSGHLAFPTTFELSIRAGAGATVHGPGRAPENLRGHSEAAEPTANRPSLTASSSSQGTR